MEHSIDMENVINDLEYLISEDCTDTQYDYVESIQIAIDVLKEQPEIIRCKGCRYAEVSDNEHTWCDHVDHEFCHKNDWFCADGEKRTE